MINPNCNLLFPAAMGYKFSDQIKFNFDKSQPVIYCKNFDNYNRFTYNSYNGINYIYGQNAIAYNANFNSQNPPNTYDTNNFSISS